MTKSIADTTYKQAMAALETATWHGNDGDFLAEIQNLRFAASQLETATRTAVITARANGATWDDVGHALGITRQAAQQRYGR